MPSAHELEPTTARRTDLPMQHTDPEDVSPEGKKEQSVGTSIAVGADEPLVQPTADVMRLP